MTAQDAFNQLDPNQWAQTPIVKRLEIIEQVQKNLSTYSKELGEADSNMKNNLLGEQAISPQEGMGSTIMAMGNTLMGIHHLYESLMHGEMPKPLDVERIADDLYKVEVYPKYSKDKLAAGGQKGYLYIKGAPKQTNPIDKPAGIIAVSGAGNYSSSIEMAMALFLEKLKDWLFVVLTRVGRFLNWKAYTLSTLQVLQMLLVPFKTQQVFL